MRKHHLLDFVAPLYPGDFFNHVFLLSQKPKRLPRLTDLFYEDPFADIALGWSPNGLTLHLDAHVPFQEAAYPNYDAGDSLELFIDTRALKEAGFATRFCHHFVILPQPVLNIQVQEVTHFRSEDTHPLCDPSLIECAATFGKSSYTLDLFFPSDVLHGYDPATCPRLGFTYKINRYRGAPQHFSVSSHQYNIAQQPSLWATLNLE